MQDRIAGCCCACIDDDYELAQEELEESRWRLREQTRQGWKDI